MLRDFVGIFQASGEQNEIWLKKSIPSYLLNQERIEGEFFKIGRTFLKATLRYYFLVQNWLFYGTDSNIKNIKGFCDIAFAYITFKSENNNHWVIIQKGSNVLEIYTQNIGTYRKFRDALSIYCVQTTFDKDFKLMEKLGQGSSSKVHLVISQSNPQNKYAAKIFEKLSSKQAQKLKVVVANEVSNLQLINHKSIVKIHHLYEGPQFVYILLTYCSGGTLLKRFQKELELPLALIKKLIINILDALAHMHSLGLMHRDIKPSNIIFQNEENCTEIMLVDLGFASPIKFINTNYIRCGSPGYVAPEILSYQEGTKLYSEKCDIFSLGVTLFLILYGFHPLRGFDPKETLKKNFSGKICFPKNELIAELGENFIQQMVKINPRERISAEGALQHPFLEIHPEDNMIVIPLPTNTLGERDKPRKDTQTFNPFATTQDTNNETKETDKHRPSAFSLHRRSILNSLSAQQYYNQINLQQQKSANTIYEDSFYADESSELIQFEQIRQIQIHQNESPFEKFKQDKSRKK